MRDKKICKFINDRCNELNLSANDLVEGIEEAIIQSGDDVEPKSLSTIYRWLNGEKTPEAYMYPYVAKVLQVTEDELRCGRLLPITKLQKEIKHLDKLVKQNEKEVNFIVNIIWCSKEFSRFIASLIYSSSIYFLNATFWKNSFLYLLPILLITIIVVKDSKNYRRDTNDKVKYSFINDTREVWEGLKLMYKLYKQQSLIAISCVTYLIIIVILGLIPLIEAVVYRGTFHLSCILYLFTGTFFFVKSFNEK